ncbi:SIS domain-containing protein [Clostridium lundense]|uniref:SIS domain-containing protein n=1 Tax=Clostridium lundense TaxID=319475 RepID=UPI000486F60E|nr:SIS domain-containing protein [Clostridium lundense]
MSCDLYFNVITEMINNLKEHQKENITKAAEIIAHSIMKGGIIHSFGSGHSYAAAIEVAGRAGGLIPSKAVQEPSRGAYETVEGVGTKYMDGFDLRENDCFILISNSGRNPLGIEMANHVKKHGNKIIVVTSLDVSKTLNSRHSSGKNLYEFADVVLDNMGVEGDAAVQLEGLPVKICGTSSITAAVLLNCAVLESIEIMLLKGYTPPIYMSENVDGGPEFNKKLTEKYADRLQRLK